MIYVFLIVLSVFAKPAEKREPPQKLMRPLPSSLDKGADINDLILKTNAAGDAEGEAHLQHAVDQSVAENISSSLSLFACRPTAEELRKLGWSVSKSSEQSVEYVKKNERIVVAYSGNRPDAAYYKSGSIMEVANFSHQSYTFCSLDQKKYSCETLIKEKCSSNASNDVRDTLPLLTQNAHRASIEGIQKYFSPKITALQNALSATNTKRIREHCDLKIPQVERYENTSCQISQPPARLDSGKQ